MKYGRLTFVKCAEDKIEVRNDSDGQKRGRERAYSYNWYRCDCGTLKEIRSYFVEKGHTKSCGCLRVENGRKTWKKNLGYFRGRGGWSEEYRHMSPPHKGKIRLTENGHYKYVTEEELEDMFWGHNQPSA